MDPYRTSGIAPVYSKFRNRSILGYLIIKFAKIIKTYYYKFLILYFGKWKNRFIRCNDCLFFCSSNDAQKYLSNRLLGIKPTIILEMFYHQLTHIKPSRHREQGTLR